MIFRQLYDHASGTYTYVLADEESKEAIIVDPVLEQVQRDLALVEQRLGMKLKYCLDTHVHADHVTGAMEIIRERPHVTMLQPDDSGVQVEAQFASQLKYLKDQELVHFGSRHLKVLYTPGHTSHHLCFVLDDKSLVLTGDTLLIGKCARTDFQGGSAMQLYHSIANILYKLPDNCVVYPGHDYIGLTCSTIGEEKLFNERIPHQQTSDKFVELMEGLNLPRPKLIDIAVPANLKGGVILTKNE